MSPRRATRREPPPSTTSTRPSPGSPRCRFKHDVVLVAANRRDRSAERRQATELLEHELADAGLHGVRVEDVGGRGHTASIRTGVHRRATSPATSTSSDTVARSPSASVARSAGTPSVADARIAAASGSGSDRLGHDADDEPVGQPALDPRERREASCRRSTLADEHHQRCTESNADTADVAMLGRDEDGARERRNRPGEQTGHTEEHEHERSQRHDGHELLVLSHRPCRQARRERDGAGGNHRDRGQCEAETKRMRRLNAVTSSTAASSDRSGDHSTTGTPTRS